MPGPQARALALAGGTIEGRRLTEARTEIGILWLDEADVLVRPAIEQSGVWSPDVSAILDDCLSPGATFVDVGANIGWFSVKAAGLVGEDGRVFAVEPDPANLELLRANLWRNGCRNVEVLPVAAWSHTGQLRLVPLPDGGAATEVSVDAAPYEDDPRVDVSRFSDNPLVPCARLEDFVEPPVKLMKIDAQFTDHHAIRGLERTIAASPELTIVVEFDSQELARRGEGPEAILDYYQGLGFELWLVEDGIARPTRADEVLRDGPFVDLVLKRS